jgi:amidophosphoribosyltransferase
MSTVDELFAPKFMQGRELDAEMQADMARSLGADSLRYLPVESIARAIRYDSDQLCQGCITGKYPTPKGQELYQLALSQSGQGRASRTYECEPALTGVR